MSLRPSSLLRLGILVVLAAALAWLIYSHSPQPLPEKQPVTPPVLSITVTATSQVEAPLPSPTATPARPVSSDEQVLARSVLRTDVLTYCSWQILGRAEKQLYIWAYCAEQVEPHTAVSVPVAVDLDETGHFLAVHMPRDGTHYPEDIQHLFPEAVRQAINNRDTPALIEVLERGVQMRQSGAIHRPYVLPLFDPGAQDCRESSRRLEDLPPAEGADYSGWSAYTQAQDGFSLNLPPGWKATEGWSGCGRVPDTPNSLWIFSPDGVYRLAIGFRQPDEPVYITRTGAPAGDFVDAGTLLFMGVPLRVERLVYGQLHSAVFYNSAAEVPAGGILFTLSLDIMNDTQTNQSIPPEIESQAARILASFRAVATGQPAATAAPTIALTPPLTIATSHETFQLQSQLGGMTTGVTLDGDIAYVGVGPRLAAIDVSQADAPRKVAQSEPLPGAVSTVLLLHGGAETQAVVGAGKFLILLDIVLPGEIRVAGRWAMPGLVTAMSFDPVRQMLYVGGAAAARGRDEMAGYIMPVDVSGASQGTVTPAASVALAYPVESLAGSKTALYVGLWERLNGGFAGMALLPLGINGQLGELKMLLPANDAYQNAYSMQVQGDRLYVGSYAAMFAYDISNPERLEEAWKVKKDAGGNPLMMVWGFNVQSKRIILVGQAPAGGYVAWQSSLVPPEPDSGVNGMLTASMVAAHDRRVYIARDGLEIFDVDGTSLKRLGAYQPDFTQVAGHETAGKFIYTIDASSQLSTRQTLHVLDAQTLAVVSQTILDLPDRSAIFDWYRGMKIEGDRLYLFTRWGVWIYSLSDAAHPTLYSRPAALEQSVESGAAGADGQRRWVFFSNTLDLTGTLNAFDVTDARHPVVVGDAVNFSREAVSHMLWERGRLYLLTYEMQQASRGYFYIFTMEGDQLTIRSRMPVNLGNMWVPNLAVGGDRLALPYAQGVLIYTASNPTEPQLMVELPLTHTAALAFRGDQLVAVSGSQSYQVTAIDLSDLADPQWSSAVDIPESNALSISGESLIVSGIRSGIEMFR